MQETKPYTAHNKKASKHFLAQNTCKSKLKGAMRPFLIALLIVPLLASLSSCVLQAKKKNTAPSVRIISPQDTDIFINSNLKISIESEDAEKNLATITLYHDGQVLGEAVRSLVDGQTQDPELPESWHFNWIAPENGSYNLSVEATDQLGLKTTASVTFEVQVPKPTNPAMDSIAYQTFLANRSLWENQNIENYEVDFQRICFCLPDITQPAKLIIVNQFLSNAIYLSGAAVNQDNFLHFFTIDKAFSLIEEGFNSNAAEIRVVYDDTYGFPTNVFIDYDERLADEELQFRFSNLLSN